MRRAVDVLVAWVAGVLLAPLMAGVAVALRRRLGSPVLFRQRRSGLRGQEFTILKFRTMSPERYAGEPEHDRSPRLGTFVRAVGLDELPQLWNVVRGEMSLIGPRPTLPEQVARYDERQRGRLAVRPGITGWAQVRGRNLLPWPQRIELDLWYIEHRTWRLDLKIVALTVLRLLRPRGVYGVGGVNPGFPSDVGGAAAPARPGDTSPL